MEPEKALYIGIQFSAFSFSPHRYPRMSVVPQLFAFLALLNRAYAEYNAWQATLIGIHRCMVLCKPEGVGYTQ